MQITLNIPDNLPATIVAQYINEFETKLKQLQDAENAKKVLNKIPTSEENSEAFALFAGIYNSQNFTIDAACQAFSGVERKNSGEF